jgi:transposase
MPRPRTRPADARPVRLELTTEESDLVQQAARATGERYRSVFARRVVVEAARAALAEGCGRPATGPTSPPAANRRVGGDYRLTDAQWQQIQDLLPANGRPGRRWNDHRMTIEGIRWALAAGGGWRNLPAEFGPWQSVYHRFRRWTRDGLWDKILRRLRARPVNRRAAD